jgi:uncharacterized Tic20 family protein
MSTPASSPAPTDDERNWAMLAHLSGFLFAALALGVLGPICVYLIKGEKSQFIRAHAVEAINFNITVLAGLAISGVLTIILIGFFMLAVIGIAYLVLTIKAALCARDGELYRYPFIFRLAS